MWRARLIGLAFILSGIVGYWYNWHLAATDNSFSIKLCIYVPLALAGGVLVMFRPQYTGPLRKDSPRSHKVALTVVVSVMAVGSGIEFFRLKSYVDSHAPRAHVIPWTPAMGTPKIPASFQARYPETSAAVNFMGRQYRLGSYNQKSHPMWEFVAPGETIDNWKTLLTVIDRADARSREDLDRLAEGLLTLYKSRGARILASKTMAPSPGVVFNYIVAAFEEPAQQRYELDFVKIALGPANAVETIYGVRVGGSPAYAEDAKAFLNRDSAGIGRALETISLPDLDRLPRRVF